MVKLVFAISAAMLFAVCCTAEESQPVENPVEGVSEEPQACPAQAQDERKVPESGFDVLDDGTVKVSVYLDLAKIRDMRRSEGTAMVKAHELLRKARPDLPPKYAVNGKVLLNSKNRQTGIYSYIVEYSSDSMASVIRRAEEDAEKARLEAERRAAEEAEKARLEAERRTAEEAEKARLEAERKAAEGATKQSPQPVQVNLKEITKQEIVEKIDAQPKAKKPLNNAVIDDSMADFDIDE